MTMYRDEDRNNFILLVNVKIAKLSIQVTSPTLARIRCKKISKLLSKNVIVNGLFYVWYFTFNNFFIKN